MILRKIIHLYLWAWIMTIAITFGSPKSLFNYNILLHLDPPRLLMGRKLKHRGPVTQPARNFFLYFTIADVKCFFPLACCQAGGSLH